MLKSMVLSAILHFSIPHQVDNQTINKIADVIVTDSRMYNVDPFLIVAVVWRESHFDPQAKSEPNGKDRGLMQVRQSGAAAGWGFTDDQLHDPWVNVTLGAAYLHESVNKCGSVLRALGRYSSGRCQVNHYAKRVWWTYKKIRKEKLKNKQEA